jgi:EmrB/QacA subfamily drug resistance transporter
MAFIDGTVVNVALPALQRSLGATLANEQWIVEAYQLMLAALLLVGGATGDRFGRRRVFVIGLGLFTIASAICGSSRDVATLILARGFQGVGGALLIPGSLSLLSASFDKEKRGRAIGTWSGFTAMTSAFGPVLGGFLIDHASWRYAFFMNVPLAVVVVVLTFRFVPESRNDSSPKAIDWMGSVLAAIALGGIVYALIESQSAGWSDRWVIGALAVGLLMLPAFLLFELRHPAPILPPALFRSSDFSGANLLTLLLYAALGGSLFFVPMNLIQVQGYSGDWADDCGVRFRAVCGALRRRQLLGHVLPCSPLAGLWDDRNRRPADDDSHDVCRSGCRGYRVGRQQCGCQCSWIAGDSRPGDGDVQYLRYSAPARSRRREHIANDRRGG